MYTYTQILKVCLHTHAYLTIYCIHISVFVVDLMPFFLLVPSHGFFEKYPQALDDLETAAHQVRLRLDWKHATGG